MGGIGRAVVADVRPLRGSPEYRRLWFGTTVSELGQQMTTLAVAVQVYAVTGSNFAVGTVGLFSFVPLAAFGLCGGAIADAVDRRRLALATSGGLAALSVVLAAQAYLHLRNVWLLYAVVALQSGLFAMDNPARNAIIPRLLPAAQLPAANALATVSWNFGLTVGPLLAGLIIGGYGFPLVYTADVATFTAALYAIWRLPPMAPLGDQVTRAGLTSVLEGLRFLRTRPNVLMTFLVDIDAMVFGMPRALFPAVAGSFYSGGSRTAGVLAAAPAVGALGGALFSGWLSRVRRQGRAVLVAVVAWGVAVAGFGFSRALWLGVLLLAAAGCADMISAVFRNTILQVATPDALRGRLQGVFIVVVAGGPRLGDFEAGTVAALSTETVAIVSGGLACVAGVALLAAHWPDFARYDARDPAP